MTEHTIAANGINHHVLEAGDGPPMLLLHGWPQTNYAWRKVMPALAEHYRVAAPDLRGMGRTDKPDGPYDMRTVAADIRALIAALGMERPYIVGHDWGGLVARRFALDYPGEADRLAIVDVAPHEQALQNINAQSARGLWHFFFNVHTDLATALVEGREEIFLSHFFRDKCCDPETFIADCVAEYAAAMAAPGALRGGLKYYQAMFAENRALDAETAQMGLKIAEPLLLLWGTQGGVGAVADLMAMWESEADNLVRGVAFEQSGHYLAEEEPEKLIGELLTFETPT
ncbi:MAG: alpha/beta hydrolase [Alphaproteobacteria bacterium]|nr:alpha/beta hydrolase [Alphaproteobacteria bacterium]